VLIDVDDEKSELLVNNRLRTNPFRGLSTTPISIQMTEASVPAVSAEKVHNVLNRSGTGAGRAEARTG
jgi:hypothetical protein